MKKISTLFKKNPVNLGRVIDEMDPANAWVFDEGVKATRKFDGVACAIIGGDLYKRYNVKPGRGVPVNAIPCQKPDEITGHWPHWVLCDRLKPEDHIFWEGYDNYEGLKYEGSYELIGPKVNRNPEKVDYQVLVKHGETVLPVTDLTFSGIKRYLEITNIEGIVFHHPDGRMCKIRKSDFGIKR